MACYRYASTLLTRSLSPCRRQQENSASNVDRSPSLQLVTVLRELSDVRAALDEVHNKVGVVSSQHDLWYCIGGAQSVLLSVGPECG